jgi:hypothetical protein
MQHAAIIHLELVLGPRHRQKCTRHLVRYSWFSRDVITAMLVSHEQRDTNMAAMFCHFIPLGMSENQEYNVS